VPRFLGTGNVNLLGALSGIGKDNHPIWAHLKKPATYCHSDFLTILPDEQLARLQHSHEWGMVWQYAQLPLNARSNNYIHIIGID
jgi:hypothetical protein